MIRQSLALAFLAAVALPFGYLDYRWAGRLREEFADQRDARRICARIRDRGESTRLLKWSDLGLRAESAYYRRLEYLNIAEDSITTYAEIFCLVGFAAIQACILVAMGVMVTT